LGIFLFHQPLKMLKKFKKWRDGRGSETEKTVQAADLGPGPMPVLPSPRPRSITPDPSRQDLRESMSQATAKSALFQKVPADVRRLILREAFGDRTLHMDLFDDGGPLLTPKGLSAEQGEPGHAGISYDADMGRPLSSPASSKMAWRFVGSICHRDTERHMRDKTALQSGPEEDTCAGGRALCREWQGHPPESCRIGIMGWLRCCRQA
jgi:hypothetical protein